MPSISSAQDITKLGTIMGIWAHPDDETFCSGGIIAAAAANGQQVICVTATKGQAGVQDEKRWPVEDLGEIRARELADACQILGVTKHHWLDYFDGHCEQANQREAVGKLKKLIDQYQPDTILTFGRDGYTGHLDHQTVCAWADKANAGQAEIYHVVQDQDIYDHALRDFGEKFNWFSDTVQPPLRNRAECDIALELTPDLIEKKQTALLAQPSQYDRTFKEDPDFVQKTLSVECFVKD